MAVNQQGHLLAPAHEPSSEGTLTVLGMKGSYHTSWAALAQPVDQSITALRRLGLTRGGVLGLRGWPSRWLLEAAFSAWAIGAAVAFLPTKASRRNAALGLPPELVCAVTIAQQADVDAGTTLCAAIHDGVLQMHTAPEYTSVSPATMIVQITSGTTSQSRALEIERVGLLEHHAAIVSAAGIRRGEERFVSWLPLYHDMGLLGFFLLPKYAGANLTLLDTRRFLARPSCWFEQITLDEATITGAPDFAYSLIAKGRSTRRIDLRSMRLAFNGGELVRPSTVRAFSSSFADCGLRNVAPYPVYGLAEATLAVSFPSPGSVPIISSLSRSDLENDGMAVEDHGSRTSLEFASVGSPLPGVNVKIARAGRPIGRGEVGTIMIKGSSVVGSYLGSKDAQRWRDGWFDTGDIGFFGAGGELAIVGRYAERIVIAGRTISPSPIEDAIVDETAIRPGGVVAFGDSADHESIVIVAETPVAVDHARLRRDIRRAVRLAAGINPRVLLVAPATLPKTSSGKLQRTGARDLYLAGHFEYI